MNCPTKTGLTAEFFICVRIAWCIAPLPKQNFACSSTCPGSNSRACIFANVFGFFFPRTLFHFFAFIFPAFVIRSVVWRVWIKETAPTIYFQERVRLCQTLTWHLRSVTFHLQHRVLHRRTRTLHHTPCICCFWHLFKYIRSPIDLILLTHAHLVFLVIRTIVQCFTLLEILVSFYTLWRLLFWHFDSDVLPTWLYGIDFLAI